MEAAPTPKPPTSRPTYMHPSDPLEPACKATPIQVSTPAQTRGHFLPNRSAITDAWVARVEQCVLVQSFDSGPGERGGGFMIA